MENSYVLQLKNRKFSEFYLCYCGYAKCESLHSFGPAVRPNYLIHLILDGHGRFQTGDATYELAAGQGFLIEPEVQTFYQADKNDPWTYLWVGFGGSRAGENGQEKSYRSSKKVDIVFLSLSDVNLFRIACLKSSATKPSFKF